MGRYCIESKNSGSFDPFPRTKKSMGKLEKKTFDSFEDAKSEIRHNGLDVPEEQTIILKEIPYEQIHWPIILHGGPNITHTVGRIIYKE